MRPVNSEHSDLVSIDDLDRNILSLCTRINAATYELLVLIREFDERAGWVQWGFSNCAEWLAWRCDFSATTASEKVRVAHALKTLPAFSSAFAAGELSYSKVRELTRVADRDTEDVLLAFALRATASHVAERCRELRVGDDASIDTAARAYANRSLRLRQDHRRGMTIVTVELPMDTGELVEKALDKARDDDSPNTPDLSDTPWPAKQADGFVNILRDYLAGSDGGSKARDDNYLVTVHVPQSALAGNGGRSALPVESVRRLCCDSTTIVITEDDQGQPLNIGRKSRTIPKAIQRAVRVRDHDCCSFPGCRNTRFLQCRHVEHWSAGGETSLDNPMLLCTRHHTAVHEGGFRIDRDYRNRWFFVRPDDVAVPDCGYHSRPFSESLNIPPAGGLLSVAENRVSEPQAEVYLH